MLAQVFIALKLFYYHIKHINADTEICFRERDKVFAIIGINPHTILEPYKSIFTHK